MKLKIVTILCIALMLTTIIPVQAQTETIDKDTPDGYGLSITTRKLGKTGIFIVKVNESYNDTIYIRISRGIGILGRGYAINRIPTFRVKLFPVKASRVNLRASLVNETGCAIESERATIRRGFTSQALIIVKYN